MGTSSVSVVLFGAVFGRTCIVPHQSNVGAPQNEGEIRGNEGDSVPAGGKNAQFDCPGHCLASAPDAQFPIGIFEVVVDGLGGDEQAGCDLLVAEALGQKIQNLELTVGEGINGGPKPTA
jgi:hypothetical protein